jgi:hypothetical protein
MPCEGTEGVGDIFIEKMSSKPEVISESSHQMSEKLRKFIPHGVFSSMNKNSQLEEEILKPKEAYQGVM